MYKFSFLISERVNERLEKLFDLAERVEVIENAVRLYILINNENILLSLSCFIDADSGTVKVNGWGSCENKDVIEKLSKHVGLKITSRKKKLSLLDFAKKVIQIYESGVRGRDKIIKELINSEIISEEEVLRYLRLLREASERKVVRKEIREASIILS